MRKVTKLFTLMFLLTLSQLIYANHELPGLENSYKIEKGSAGLEIDNIQFLAHFVDIHFDEDASHLSMHAKNEVSFIQIMNQEGELEFQLPIFSKKLTIDVNDFMEGSYSIYIMIKGEKDSIRSTFIKN